MSSGSYRYGSISSAPSEQQQQQHDDDDTNNDSTPPHHCPEVSSAPTAAAAPAVLALSSSHENSSYQHEKRGHHDQQQQTSSSSTAHNKHLLPKSLPAVSVEIVNALDYDDDQDDDDRQDGTIWSCPSSNPAAFCSRTGRSYRTAVLPLSKKIASILALAAVMTAAAGIFFSGSANNNVSESSISSSSSSSSSSRSYISSPAHGSILSQAANYLLGGWQGFEGILAGGGGGGDNSYWQARKEKKNPCEYNIAHPAFVADDDSDRDLVAIQTSKRDPGRQWSEFECRKRSGVEGDVIVPGHDAANIVIDLPSPSSSSSSTTSTSTQTKKKFQKILGFGGSITEATTLNWKSLSPVARDRVLELLYGDSGLGYTLGRVPMGSCDFSVGSYNFAEKEDLTLGSFDKFVQRDYDNGMIDMIKSARYVTEHSWEYGTELSLVASPWSPPAWMKQPLPTDPIDTLHAETMEQTALPECLREGTGAESRYANAWAKYFSEFLSAYQRHGIAFFAVTVQNDPLSFPPFEACGHDKTTEKEFVVNHLGPVLSEDHPSVKILAYDTNKDQCVDFMEYFWGGSKAFEDAALKYIDGAAVHWYSRSHSALNGGEGTPNMHRLKALASRQTLDVQDDAGASTSTTAESNRSLKGEEKEPILLDTEASHCTSTGYAIGDINISWQRAERNAHAILSQLAAGSNGWIEWNMMLDPFGGPNHVENFCDAPLVAVPHRAEGISDFVRPVPSFERHQLQDGESIKGEYETKFSLSESMGYPMSLMNLGVVVQPMYYYMGHISRHVRPGSRPLRAIVDETPGGVSSRAFRPTGRIGPGGGYNNLARDGTEVTLWPCEGSTRQSWSFSREGELRMVQYDGKKNSMECVSLADAADPDLGGILLTRCGSPDSGLFDMVAVGEGSDKRTVKLYSRKFQGACLGIRALANNGGSYGPRGGAQATMLPCKHESTIWSFTPETGEVTSAFFETGDVCMTTGWPILQAGVFDTTEVSGEGNGAIVVLNESEDDAAFVVRINDKLSSPLLKATIPSHSIQTFVI